MGRRRSRGAPRETRHAADAEEAALEAVEAARKKVAEALDGVHIVPDEELAAAVGEATEVTGGVAYFCPMPAAQPVASPRSSELRAVEQARGLARYAGG